MRLRLDLAVAAVILVPFLAVGLGFRSSLVFQAVAIVVVVAATLPALLTSEGRARVANAPRVLLGGIIMVALATAVGVVVGLIRDNGLTQIAGQALSMGLLPLAAVGGLATWADPSRRQWKTGLLVAIVIGCWVQLAWGFFLIVLLGQPSRLFLPNSISVVGPSLLGLCFSLVSLGDSNRRLRRLAWFATGSIVLVILGSSLRSLWILAPMVIVAVVVTLKGIRSRQAAIAIAFVTLLGLGMAGAVWRVDKWVSNDFPDLLDQTPCSLFPRAGRCSNGTLHHQPENARRLRFDTPVTLGDGNAWRVAVQGRGEGHGAIVVALLFFDEFGLEIARIPVPIRAGSNADRGIAVGTVPDNWNQARLRLSRWQGAAGRWQIDDVQCAALESETAVRFAAKVLAIKERALGLIRAIRTGEVDGDATLGFRWHESRRIIGALSEAPWLDRLFGKGLGATIRLDVDGFDNRGHWIHFDEVNYIHNWYLFLVFKLGLAGTVLVLGAVIGWIAWTIRAVRRQGDLEARAFLVASAVAWLTYCVWSLTSPEILDFRMAPLWGWLLCVATFRPVDP